MTLRPYLPLLAVSLAMMPLFARAVLAEPEPQVSAPVQHDNIAVYFLRGVSAPGVVPDTLQEALARGTVEVHETGNVRELKIENKGDTPVFVQFGDIVKGGQQDRVLTVSLLLQPKSGVVPIGAYCVEQGRWAARGAEDVRRFALSESIMPSREAKIAMAKPQAAPRAALGAQGVPPPAQRRQEIGEISRDINRLTRDLEREQQRRNLPGNGDSQGDVWRSVGLVQQQLTANLAAPVASEKSHTSLQLSLEHEKLKAAQTAYLGAIEPPGLNDNEIIGVVIAVNGRVSSADVYPSNGLFRKMWPKLARAAATEALAAKTVTDAGPAPDVAVIAAFLKAAETGEKTERELGGLARLETRDGDKALRIDTRGATGQVLHRNYLAK